MSKPFKKYLHCIRGVYGRVLEIDDVFIENNSLTLKYNDGFNGTVYNKFDGMAYDINEAYDFFYSLLND